MIRKDITGKRFNNLTVIEYVKTVNYKTYWKCKCDCGNYTIIIRDNLKRTKSCGCLRSTNKYLGKFPESIRQCYYNMRKRCNDKNSKSYKNYGARGITYCDKWKSLEGFLDDMLETYQEGLTLDRIDVNGMYCKENCRWATRTVQANNTTANRYFEYKGKTYTLRNLCIEYGFDYELVVSRIKKGHSLEIALSEKNELEKITYNNITKTVSEFASDVGLTYHQLKKRLMRGWTVERALNQPLRERKK